jgi:hypothetical protein
MTSMRVKFLSIVNTLLSGMPRNHQPQHFLMIYKKEETKK